MILKTGLAHRSVAAILIAAATLGAVACIKKSETISTVKEDTAVEAQFRGIGSFPIWEYDAGPDPKTSFGKSLIDLHATIPYFPGLSNAIYGDQMFRPAFGPVVWRMMQKPNSVKILFIGQDATHIAEAAGRPATAAFGGRAQDMAKHFGISSGAAFINTYAYTIRYQYGAFDTPVISNGSDGKPKISFSSVVGTPVWLLSQDLNSPITKWRNQIIESIIRNNKDSLKLIVLFGGAARDAAGSFIESKGGKVGARRSVEQIVQSKTKIPEFSLKFSGGNTQSASIFTKEGGDLLIEFAKSQGISFTDRDYQNPTKVEDIHKKFTAAFNADPEKWMARMVLPANPSGETTQDSADAMIGTGLVHPAQLGGYDIAQKIQIGNSEMGTLSLKGLKLSEDFTINNHIVVAQFPHPTALSRQTKEEASATMNRTLETIRQKFPPNLWNIEADKNVVDLDDGKPLVNRYAAGVPYKYGRADMGNEYYDFGAPNTRMVNVSSASRDGVNVIVFGTRDRASFDRATIDRMTNGFLPSAWNGNANPAKREFPFDDEVWIARGIHTDGSIQPSELNRRFTFDPGPGTEMAQLMKRNLPRNAPFTFLETDGSSINGDFGHYRGTFQAPKVVVLADPDGDDDLITARALTGTRGQYLHGLMRDLGVGDKYLVLKTAPYSNYSDADANSVHSKNWLAAVEATKGYREALLKKIFATNQPVLILTDGPFAKQEFDRIFPTAPNGIPVINIERQGLANEFGLANAASKIIATGKFQGTFQGKMADIPRSHLTYYARVWEGTSGDRVVTSNEAKFRGKAFAMVAPNWAQKQVFRMSLSDIAGCKALVNRALRFRTRLGQEARNGHGESVVDYQKRLSGQSRARTPDEICNGTSTDSSQQTSGDETSLEGLVPPL